MDFAYTAQQEALRREVRRFIKENVTPEVAEEMDMHAGAERPRGQGPKAAALYKKIH